MPLLVDGFGFFFFVSSLSSYIKLLEFSSTKEIIFLLPPVGSEPFYISLHSVPGAGRINKAVH